MWDHGKHILTGVSINIRDSDDFSYLGNPLEIGTLHPGWGKALPSGILPRLDPKTGVGVYLIEMQTQSDTYTEILHFRKSKDGKYWAHKFWVNKLKVAEREDPRGSIPPVPKIV